VQPSKTSSWAVKRINAKKAKKLQPPNLFSRNVWNSVIHIDHNVCKRVDSSVGMSCFQINVGFMIGMQEVERTADLQKSHFETIEWTSLAVTRPSKSSWRVPPTCSDTSCMWAYKIRSSNGTRSTGRLRSR
jgi:hypothetical protein